MTDDARIRDAVRAGAGGFVDALKEACSIPSISTEGQGLEEMASWLESRLKGLRAEVRRLEVPGSPPALLGEIPGPGSRTLMIYDHYDVQPVDPLDLWEAPPFEPDEREGRLYARGAADNKGDLVARLSALEVYRDVVGEIPFTIKFFIEGEEETGSPHFEDICRDFAADLSADDCVWEGGMFDHRSRPVIYFGCKGLLYVELRCQKIADDQHSSIAGYAPSAAWRLVQALSTLKDADGRISIPGFYDEVLDPEPADRQAIGDVEFEEQEEMKRLGVTEFVGGRSGDALKQELFFSPTANIAGFLTGYTVPRASKTVLPAQATAKMDFRLVPDQDPKDIAKKLRSHLDSGGFDDVEVEVLSAEHPSKSPMDTPLGRAVRERGEGWFTERMKVWPMMYATGPMYPIAKGLGVPICSPPGVGRPDSRVHAPNENARIEDYLEMVGFTVAYMEAYGAF
ncbi:MAG: M20/M25/M40 family metallo-hydrolase [Actinomycetota bacterium]